MTDKRAEEMARLCAVQALYQMDIAARSAERVLGEAADWSEEAAQMTPDTRRFMDTLVEGVSEKRPLLDAALGRHLKPGWRLARMDGLLRALLRAAALEILGKDKGASVPIAEYVRIAHKFWTGTEPGVVNGILDSLARADRENHAGKDAEENR